MRYTNKVTAIKSSDIINNDFSMSPADYRKIQLPKTYKKLSSLIDSFQSGFEIGSDFYIESSSIRFLKTNNITSSLLLDESNIEYAIPHKKAIQPKDNSILLVKDGGTGGLGEVVIYKKTNNYTDYISSGIIEINIQDETLKYYILGVLKSNHFKEYIDNVTPGGSTIRHSKFLALDYNVPFPKQKELQKLVSLITQNIVDKEQQIKNKNSKIDKMIQDELNHNSNPTINYPTANEIINSNFRFDTGLYSKEYKSIKSSIETYTNGYFKLLDIGILKSGNTPKERVIKKENDNSLLREWITPTIINKYGLLKRKEYIFNVNGKYNLNKNALLFINRGSEKNIGINLLYIHSNETHHNQGLYRLEFNNINTQILFVSAIFNSKLYRTYIGKQGSGSKMIEIKTEQLENSFIPDFPEELQKNIAQEYFNEINPNTNLTLNNYLEKETQRNSQLGIWQLNMEIMELKGKLENIISDIVFDNEKDYREYIL